MRARKLRLWGKSTPEIAAEAEKFAVNHILPKEGFADFYHASSTDRFFPFDIIAALNGQRVLIDVTTGLSKMIMRTGQKQLADALLMPMYVLFVKPDFSKYQLKQCKPAKTVAIRISELVPIE